MDYQLKPGETRDALGVIKKHPVGTRTVDGVIIATCRAYQAPLPSSLQHMQSYARPQVPHRTRAYHVQTGAVEMPTIDAHAAVKNHPKEWSLEPWPALEPSAPTQAA